MFNNLPVLNHKKTFLKSKDTIVKTLTYEDVHRCLEKKDAKKMLIDNMAETAMVDHLQKQYSGKIKTLQFINYDPERIVRSFHSPQGELGQDHLNEFQSFIDYKGKN